MEAHLLALGSGSGSGTVGGAVAVAVADSDWRWQCGHFDRWQVEIPFWGAGWLWLRWLDEG
jgi:hypothetical protein